MAGVTSAGLPDSSQISWLPYLLIWSAARMSSHRMPLRSGVPSSVKGAKVSRWWASGSCSP
ncbi:Uncharacterised protein [Mycobacteroides abscessus subsp. abscessus]|nr:Uncharacterised protein [Mycobacteroides abscessus subsp. abscessus]